MLTELAFMASSRSCSILAKPSSPSRPLLSPIRPSSLFANASAVCPKKKITRMDRQTQVYHKNGSHLFTGVRINSDPLLPKDLGLDKPGPVGGRLFQEPLNRFRRVDPLIEL